MTTIALNSEIEYFIIYEIEELLEKIKNEMYIGLSKADDFEITGYKKAAKDLKRKIKEVLGDGYTQRN